MYKFLKKNKEIIDALRFVVPLPNQDVCSTMKTYSFDEIEQIKEYSDTFNIYRSLCKDTWICFNANSKKEKYIFHKDGKITITRGGNGKTGRWEWLYDRELLEIETNGNVTILSPEYVEKSIIVFSLDDSKRYVIFILQDEEELVTLSQNELKVFFANKLQQHYIRKEEFYLIKDAQKIANKLMPWWFREYTFILMAVCVFYYLCKHLMPIKPISYCDESDLLILIITFWISLIATFLSSYLYYSLFHELALKIFKQNLNKWQKDNPENDKSKYIEFI